MDKIYIDGDKMARVMVVDDALFMRSLIKSILKSAGHYIVAEAKDGEEAFAKYMLYKPDIVTMDITMHGMDGLDAVKYITEQDPDAKIIMVSAMSQKSMVIKAIKNGAKHFIIKPITAENVLRVVNEVLGIQADTYINREDFKDIKQAIEEMKKAINEMDRDTTK